jgi:hypothetical protein
MNATKLAFRALAALVSVSLCVAGCAATGLPPLLAGPTPAASPKINFDTAAISAAGLEGPPDGLVAVSYEFCIPATSEAIAEVQRMDPSAHCTIGSHGRIGCTKDEALCIGSTEQVGWLDVLNALAALPYVARIDRSFGE